MEFKPYMKSDYGKLADKVNLLPDFFHRFSAGAQRRDRVGGGEVLSQHN